MLNPGKDSHSKTEPCCDQRHACYQTCGMLKTICDEQFLKCSEETCATIPDKEEREECEKASSIQLLMVKFDQSCQRYDQAQYTHCECVEKSKAADKRERVLRSFYKKFNPGSVDKADGLAKKVDNSVKMAGLLMKLVIKYPAAVKKMKDPQQEYIENLMRDTEKENGEPSAGDGGDAEDSTKAAEQESDAEDLGVDEL